jgi:hypothetical protein
MSKDISRLSRRRWHCLNVKRFPYQFNTKASATHREQYKAIKLSLALSVLSDYYEDYQSGY